MFKRWMSLASVRRPIRLLSFLLAVGLLSTLALRGDAILEAGRVIGSPATDILNADFDKGALINLNRGGISVLYDLMIQTNQAVAATEIMIDIKPGSDRNPLNLNGKGVVPVAVFGSVNFNVHEIDIGTVRFGINGDEAAPVHRGHIVSPEGGTLPVFDFIVFHFRKGELGVPTNTPHKTILTLTLTGELADGTEFEGQDDVSIRGKWGRGPE